MSKIMRKSETEAEAMARHRMENIEGVTEEAVTLTCASTENTIRHAIQNGDFSCGIELTQERFKAAVAEAIYIAAIDAPYRLVLALLHAPAQCLRLPLVLVGKGLFRGLQVWIRVVERVARLLGCIELSSRGVHLSAQLRQLFLWVALRLHELLVALARERLAVESCAGSATVAGDSDSSAPISDSAVTNAVSGSIPSDSSAAASFSACAAIAACASRRNFFAWASSARALSVMSSNFFVAIIYSSF